MSAELDELLIKRLAEERDEIEDTFNESLLLPPDHSPEPTDDDSGWWPRLTPRQKEIFECDSRYVLAYGERGSGKSMGILHRLVRHCYENENALAMVVTLVRTAAIEGGSWEKLLLHILPEWREGIGLSGGGPDGEFEEKTDDAKNRIIWVSNKHGGWSKIILRSMPNPQQIRARFKGSEPSLIFFDELTEAETERYFTDSIQQLGRRSGIKCQQFLSACNPSEQGEDHWVYQRFFVMPRNEETGEWDKRYAVFHVPMSENVFLENREEYVRTVIEACRTDPTAYARLVQGKWVKAPSGDGIFAKYFSLNVHTRGNRKKKEGILPHTRFPIVVGLDPGTASTGISFTQNLPLPEKDLWTVFDELALVDKYIPIPQMVPMMLRKMEFWCAAMNHPFKFIFVADAAAFNQMRPDGSYDSRKIEKVAAWHLKHKAERYPHLAHLEGKIGRLKGAPKGAGSVSARVKMMIDMLETQSLLVSQTCPFHIDMFRQLECEKPREGEYKANLPFTPRRMKWIHIFDSLTYPIFYRQMGGGFHVETGKPKSEFH